jgi:hypothetical protein
MEWEVVRPGKSFKLTVCEEKGSFGEALGEKSTERRLAIISWSLLGKCVSTCH